MGDESLKTQQPHQELKAFTCQFSLGPRLEHPSRQFHSFSWPTHSSWHSAVSKEPLFTLHLSPPYSDLKHAQARHRSYTPRHWLFSHLSTHHCTWREKAAATRLIRRNTYIRSAKNEILYYKGLCPLLTTIFKTKHVTWTNIKDNV